LSTKKPPLFIHLCRVPPKWLKPKLKSQFPEMRNHWSGGVLKKDLKEVSESKKVKK
jgi:hypothetical protein